MPVREPSDSRTAGEIAASLLRFRRLRDTQFTQGLFAEPAWDMLLDLVVAEEAGRRMAVSGLGVAAAVPSTTALRYIQALEREGLIEREPDPKDGRRVWVRLTPSAFQCLQDLLAKL
jgi:DNA-binding MarR family transcriptional regulator